jgi:parallel beta-helix repeat protein
MRKSLQATLFVCSVILLTAMGFQCTRTYSQDASPENWPMFHTNPSHDGAGTGNPVLSPELFWSYNTGVNLVYASPAVYENTVYIGTGNGTLYALDAISGNQRWKYNAYTGSSQISSCPAVVNGVVYVGVDSFIPGRPVTNIGVICALNASNGEKLWDFQTGGPISSPNVVGNVVFFGTYNNSMYALNANNGVLLWNYTTGGSVLSSPAVVNGIVYFGSFDSNVYALNATNGFPCWNFTTGNDVVSSPAVVEGTVFVGSEDGNVYALNAATGAKVWSYVTEGYVDSSPAVASNVVYVGSVDGNVYALDASNGVKLWNFTTGDAVYSSPAVVGSVVYVGSFDGNVYALSANNGSKLWNYATSSFVRSSPAVANGLVYIGSYDGNVYALGIQGTSTEPPNVLYPNTFVISADGRVTPSTTLIQQTGNTYSLTEDMSKQIWLQKSDVVLDGKGHTNSAIHVNGQTNVTIKNFGGTEISLHGVSNFTVLNNTLSTSDMPWYETSATAVDNSSSVIIVGNTITNGDIGILMTASHDNLIVSNTISGMSTIWQHASAGIMLYNSSNNTIHHNNFINNTFGVGIEGLSSVNNRWDDGESSGGNYWEDYQSKYLNASEKGNSGIWNTQYVIDTNNIDRYPLVDHINITAPLPTPTPPTPTLNLTSTASPASSPSIPEFPIGITPLVLMTATLIAMVFLKVRDQKEAKLKQVNTKQSTDYRHGTQNYEQRRRTDFEPLHRKPRNELGAHQHCHPS